jgi:hypothetical protein
MASLRPLPALAALAVVVAPTAAHARRPRVPVPAQGTVSFGLVRDRLLIRIGGPAAAVLHDTMPDAREMKGDGTPWRRGANIACRVDGEVSECRIELTRGGALQAPATWAATEPSGTFSYLPLPDGAATAAQGRSVPTLLTLDAAVSTQVALWAYKARGPLTCDADASMGSKLAYTCAVQIDARGRAARPPRA